MKKDGEIGREKFVRFEKTRPGQVTEDDDGVGEDGGARETQPGVGEARAPGRRGSEQ